MEARGKQLKKSAWFRPADSIVLAGEMKKVLEEEDKRLNLNIIIIERGGTSLKN